MTSVIDPIIEDMAESIRTLSQVGDDYAREIALKYAADIVHTINQ